MTAPPPEQFAETVAGARVGFSGTREGMTVNQVITVQALLNKFTFAWAHHGDCVGADAEFHDIAKASGLQVAIHPPSDPKLRARLVGDGIAEEKPYLARNRDIVEVADMLIATPAEYQEQPKGGTWYTIRYAREQGKPVIIVWPDGDAQFDGDAP